MMTKDFEPITEVGIHQDDFGEGVVASDYSDVCQLSGDNTFRNVFICIVAFCREVHYCGVGEEGDSVPWFRGETSSAAENSGLISITRTIRLSNVV